jgi:hypothetical protein
VHFVDRLGGDFQGGPEGQRTPGDLGYSDQYTPAPYRVPDPRRIGDTGPILGPRSGVELPPLPFASDATTGALPPLDLPASEPSVPVPPPSPPSAPLPPPPVPPLSMPPLAEPEGPGGVPRGPHHSERATVRRPGGPGSHSNLYYARRAGLVSVLTAVAVVAELLVVRVLVTGEFGHTVVPGSVLGAMCAMAGIPLVTVGLYGVMTGAPAAAAHPSSAWLRAPLAYLPVGLVLLIAASLAVS